MTRLSLISNLFYRDITATNNLKQVAYMLTRKKITSAYLPDFTEPLPEGSCSDLVPAVVGLNISYNKGKAALKNSGELKALIT